MFFGCLPCCGGSAVCTCTAGSCIDSISVQITAVSMIDHPFLGPYNVPPVTPDPVTISELGLACNEKSDGCRYGGFIDVFDQNNEYAGFYDFELFYTPQYVLDSAPALPQFTGLVRVSFTNAVPAASAGPYDMAAGSQYFDFDLCGLDSSGIGVIVTLGTEAGQLQLQLRNPGNSNPLP